MTKINKRKLRHLRIRKKIIGTQDIPRLSVFRSNKNIYAQLIDDKSTVTVVSASSLKLLKSKKEEKTKLSKTDIASLVGESLANAAISKKITKIVFDRSGYKYHGRVKSLAESARKGGLKF